MKKQKIFLYLLTLFLLLLSSGCMIFDSEIYVNPEEKVSFQGNLYLTDDLFAEQDSSKQFLIQLFPDIHFEEKQEKIVTIQEENYHQISFYGTLSKELAIVTKERNQIHFELLKENFEKVKDFFNLDVKGEEENNLQSLAEYGIQARLVIVMPGEIISSTIGKIQGNKVTINLLESYDQEIRISSTATSLSQKSFFITLIACSFAYYIFIAYKEKQSQKKV